MDESHERPHKAEQELSVAEEGDVAAAHHQPPKLVSVGGVLGRFCQSSPCTISMMESLDFIRLSR